MEIRDVETLARVNDAWPTLSDLAGRCPVGARVLPVSGERASQTLHSLQVTTRSALGGLAYNTGGLVVDHGWLRILGGGEGHLHSLADANGLGDATNSSMSPGFLVVAEDILGGRFAIDGGALGVEPGKVCYFGPDTLEWTGLGIGHGDFVKQMLSGATVDFYAELRWAGWEAEAGALELDQGLSVYPPPFTVEGRDLHDASRSPVQHRELVGFLDEAAQQIP